MRVPLIVFALVAMPFAAGLSQGQSGGRANPNADNRCKDPAAATRQDRQHRAAAQANQKNCPVPVPPPAPPPPAPPPPAPPPPPPPPPPAPEPEPEPGIHKALGIVYEEIDGVAGRDPFSGEMGLMGWTVQLYNSVGELLASTTTGETDPSTNSNFTFPGLANGTYSVCVVGQSGYTQTAPTSGSGCGSLGYTFSINGMLVTWVSNLNFGMMAQ